MSRWQNRLGHPTPTIVKHVVSSHNFPIIDQVSSDLVCDACQQLPYPKSSSVSHFALELVFSDVWGLAPELVGRKKYCVRFIDDHSKFTWIYQRKYKYVVFHKFQEFKTLVCFELYLRLLLKGCSIENSCCRNRLGRRV